MSTAVYISFFAVLCCSISPGLQMNVMEKLQKDVTLKRFLATLEPYGTTENDVVFVLDESGSIGADVFPQAVEFTELIARQLSVSQKDSQLAVITYGTNTRTHIDYIQYSKWKNMCTFLKDLRKIDYKGGGTHTGDALRLAMKILQRGRSYAKKIVILLSDGQSNGGENVITVAQDLKRSHVTIFSVGVASVNEVELNAVSTSLSHTYVLTDFNLIYSLNDYLINDTREIGFDKAYNNSLCNDYCSSQKDCCDVNAECYCGIKTGRYECSCSEGFGGTSGYRGQCKPCGFGTYKNKIGNTECVSCPANSTTLNIGSTSVMSCACIVGHIGSPENGKPCMPIGCNQLKPPEGGMLVPNNCGHTYGTKCNFKCHNGYCPNICVRGNDAPRGDILPWNFMSDEPRRCLENGKWSGNDFYCDKRRCPALEYPKNGNHNCTTDKTDFGFGTVCELTCNKGFNLIGSSLRTCLMDESWTGTDTYCEVLLCPALKTNADLWIKPKECGVKDMPYSSICYYYCKNGKTLTSDTGVVGAKDASLGVRKCELRNKWSGVNEKLYCRDIDPPRLTCPASVSIETDFGEKFGTASWNLPIVEDNSNVNYTAYVIEPKGFKKPPHAFPIGQTKVVYEAVDDAGNNNTCSFTITVSDTQPPSVDKCPEDIVVHHSSKTGVEVTWEEPKFSDNSKTVTVLSINRKSGDRFKWGPSSQVIYQVSDPSGNLATCSFWVAVKAYPCPYVEPPANGFLSCDNWSNGQLCRASCREKYAFPSSGEVLALCSQRKKEWIPLPGTKEVIAFPLPDCAEIQPPKGVNVGVQVSYSVSTCSDEDLTKVKQQFITALMKRGRFYCQAKMGCTVKNVKVLCKKAVKKTKRSVFDTVLASPESENHLRHEKHRQRARRQTEEEAVLLVSFDIEIDDDSICENCSEKAVLSTEEKGSEISGVLATGVTELVQNVYHSNSTVQNSVEYNIVPICKTGAVLQNNTCVKCPVGTYFNESSSTCKVCSVNFYQDVEGSLSCKECPKETRTLMTRSRSMKDCRALCIPGTFSATSLEPCTACPKGFYQEHWAYTYCFRCPSSTTTTMSGASTSTLCVSACVAGFYSGNGYSPCQPCPIGTYQPFLQQTECFSCPMGTTTLVQAAQELSYCQTVHFCKDLKPCENGATCEDNGVSYKCQCVAGFTGKNCATNVDDCMYDVCENDGVCIDRVNGFECSCKPGFNGSRCEYDVDDCRSGPCENGGVCTDLVDDYTCTCLEGFYGRNCEHNPDDCDSNPCLNGGKCFDMISDYRCCCPEGYTDRNCSTEIDMCVSQPCQNGATCKAYFNYFTCFCAPGFHGLHCEINIDDCLMESCQNGGTCIDQINGMECACPLMYFGPRCENVVPDEFLIKFSQPTYVSLYNSRHLYGVTLSFFMRTTSVDPDQRETPVSYSYNNNKTHSVVDNGLTLYDTNKLIIFLHGAAFHTGYAANSNPDWHHYAVTWNSLDGVWAFYVDGNNVISGSGVAIGEHFHPGVFVLGQEQDNVGGGFSSLESFTGEITEFNVWNYAFTSEEIKKLSASCGFLGNVIPWPLTLKHLQDDVVFTSEFGWCANKQCGPHECNCKGTRDRSVCHHAVESCSPLPCANGQTCIENNGRFACNCTAGFEGRFCEYDVDECMVRNGGCSHVCTNVIGSSVCSCPTNMVLDTDGHTCIDAEFCRIGESIYEDGEQWEFSCEICSCSKGHVTCQNQACPSLTCNDDEEHVLLPSHCCKTCISSSSCNVLSDTIETFDKFRYLFRGNCQYTLVEGCFDGTFDVAFERSNSSEGGYSVIVHVLCERVTISPSGVVTVNDVETLPPFRDEHVFVETVHRDSDWSNAGNVSVNDLDSLKMNLVPGGNTSVGYAAKYIRLWTMHGVIVEWQHLGSLAVKVPKALSKKTCGLCGNFNGKAKDDQMLKSSLPARMLKEFVESWKVDKDCPESPIQLPLPKLDTHRSSALKQKVNDFLSKRLWLSLNCPNLTDSFKTTANNACRQFWSPEFQKCHEVLNPNVYFFLCLRSSCRCRGNSLCFCDSLLFYVEECAKRNVTITDLDSAGSCWKYCSSGMVYKECGPACPATCSSLSPSSRPCLEHWHCVPGCYCPEGTLLHKSRCISEKKCLKKNKP